MVTKLREITDEALHDSFNDFIRGEAVGKIDLAVPVSNILVWKNRYSILLDIPETDLEKVIYYVNYVVSDPRESTYHTGDILTEAEYIAAKDQIVAETGEKALRVLMDAVDTNTLLREARKQEQECMAILDEIYDLIDEEEENAEYDSELLENTGEKLEKIRYRIDLIYRYRANPEAEKIESIRVLPIEVRAALAEVIKQTPYLSRHYEMLYSRIYHRNERLKKLLEICAPEIIIRNESRILQERVDELLSNKERGIRVFGNREKEEGEVDLRYRKPSLTDLMLDRIKMV